MLATTLRRLRFFKFIKIKINNFLRNEMNFDCIYENYKYILLDI